MLKAERDQKPTEPPSRLEGLTDEPMARVPRRAPGPTLMTWAGIALLMAGAALMAARSETGAQRIARLFTPAAPAMPRTEPPRPVATDPMLLYETRRLAEQVRALAVEREQLTERVAAMERSVGDVTASISSRGEASRGEAPRSEALARPVRVIEGSPAATTVTPAPVAPPPAATVPPGNAPTAAPVPTRSPALATSAAPPAADESTAIRTEFGVDLAGETSIEALRARWTQLRNQHGPVLEGLRPVVAIQEGRGGAVELRLVAGPLSNANAASRLCATLANAGVNCKPAVFDGQRLALR